MKEKNWLEPTEVLEYDPALGEVCVNDPENDWSEVMDDGVGEDIDENEEVDG